VLFIDVVQQLAEAFITKLFALSYGFSNIDVHSGSGVADFVHKFTHSTCRGVLLVVGRPGEYGRRRRRRRTGE